MSNLYKWAKDYKKRTEAAKLEALLQSDYYQLEGPYKELLKLAEAIIADKEQL